jgi:hypothetical protein
MAHQSLASYNKVDVNLQKLEINYKEIVMTLEEFLNSLTEEEATTAQEILEKNPSISVHLLAIMLNNNDRKPVL